MSDPHGRVSLTDVASDAIAGVTLWAVFAAQALAYGRLAHASPTSGLVTAMAGALVYTALGSSRRMSIGPAGGIAAIVGSAMASVPPDRFAAVLSLQTLLVAALLAILGLARVTILKRLFPTPVFVGYIAGTGVTILIGQGRDLVSHGWLPFGIGAAAAGLVVALKRLAPRLPGPFIALLLATVASVALGLQGRGVPVIGDSLGHFGHLTLPLGLRWSEVESALGAAIGLAIITYVDALANGDQLAQLQDPPLRPRREYFALAATNLASAALGGFTVGCSTSRSLVGIHSGARTRLAPLVAGVLLVLTALSVTRFLQPMPLAALAGVVFVAAFDLINVPKLRQLWALRRADFVTAAIAGAGVVGLGMVKGVVVGVAAALVEALRRAMQPHRQVIAAGAGDRYYEAFDPRIAGAPRDLMVYRFGAPLFFGNADVFVEDMRAIASRADHALRTVVINADALGVPDATAREALAKGQAELAARGIRMVFGNARLALREALTKAGGFELIDENEFMADLRRVRAAPA